MSKALSAVQSAVQPAVTPNSFDWAQLLLRAIISVAIVAIFIWINYSVIEIIAELAKQDSAFIGTKTIQPDDRLVNANVIMSLIAGTVAQVITVLLGITRFLFPAG